MRRGETRISSQGSVPVPQGTFELAVGPEKYGEIVVGLGQVGVERDGREILELGLRGATQRRQQCAALVPRLGKLRVETERRVVMAFRLGKVAVLLELLSQVIVRLSIVGIVRHGRGQLRLRLVILANRIQRHAQRAVRGARRRVEVQRHVQGGERLIDIAFVQQNRA